MSEQTSTRSADDPDYVFISEKPPGSSSVLWPIVVDELNQQFKSSKPEDKRVFDLGCGNGSLMVELQKLGYDVSGVDPSDSGIEYGKNRSENIRIEMGSAYDDLAATWGQFPALVSLEVVEHVYAPRTFAKTAFELLEPGGTAIISTPFHGYWKNLLLAATGRLDKHFTALWDHGHIKFWSVKTLGELLKEIGFTDIRFRFAGRFYPFSMSMVAIARRPNA